MQRMHLYSVLSWECCGSSKTTACGCSGKGKKRLVGARKALLQNWDWWWRCCRQWNDNGRRVVNFGSSNFFSSGRAQIRSCIPVSGSFSFSYPRIKGKKTLSLSFHIWKSQFGYLLITLTIPWKNCCRMKNLRDMRCYLVVSSCIPTWYCGPWIHVTYYVVCVLSLN